MVNPKTEMFNKKASDPKNKPEDVLKALQIRLGQNIADIGSGGGYFSLRFADAVGKDGTVYAVDVNPSFLETIKGDAEKKGLPNVRTVLASNNNIDIPKSNLDLIFMRNVYHHLKNRPDYFRNLKAFLKPDGKIAIIEHSKGGRFGFVSLFGHHTSQVTIIKELEQAGYQTEKSFDFLQPRSSFTVFSHKVKVVEITENKN